ncbi:hypothetical protein [Micromonospora peucetia]|uniref:Uncharacterized protein n=1 Tax=Micromonospora peucetia TaxID=47871 RepID=A0ABZ1EJX5_9ACTN|nr:hypothetical protein [Micromonospora peucetia]WSA34570.1 hypothetical protein OIE14_11250 [Micromonospora peucetia]
MTAADRAGRAARLKLAVDEMASRYGTACMRYGMAVMAPDIIRAERTRSRRYRALMRLTAALADVATEAR